MTLEDRSARLTVMVIIAIVLAAGSIAGAAAQNEGGDGDPVLTASPSVAPVVATSGAPYESRAVEVAPSLIMGPPDDRTLGGWREIGRIVGEHGIDRLIGTVGDRLVAMGAACEAEDGPCTDIGWHSLDGVTWVAAELPGRMSAVTDTASTSDGLVAVGYAFDPGSRGPHGAVWTSLDGTEWTRLAAPPVAEVDRVAASDESIVATGGGRFWVSADGSDWERVQGPVGGVPVAGPGGYLAAEGGGQDGLGRTRLWRSTDGLEWKKARLPRALRKAKSEGSILLAW